jgi:zinc finger protein
MKDIPYFKEVVIMSFYCEECGYRNNEIKTGGEISAQGKRTCLLVKKKIDLSRDLLKSETASLFVPEIDLSLGPGTLGGRFTTIEGILSTTMSELRNNVFLQGDSADPAQKEKMQNFLVNLKELIELKREFHVIIEDPLANSFVQNLRAPEPDQQLEEELYHRSPEESERLGITALETKSKPKEEK